MMPEKNRVLIPLYYYYPYVSGLTIYAKRVAESLASLGYDVTVLTSRHDKLLPKAEKINGVKVVRRPVVLRFGKGVIMPTFWFDIIRFARKYDYVNAHLPMADSGLSSLFISKSKLVTTYHCDLKLGNGLIDRALETVSYGSMHLQLMRSRAIMTSTKDYLKHSRMKRYTPKAYPVYPMVTANEFNPVSAEQLFKHIGAKEKTVKIGFMGRVVYEKGINYLLQAIPYLQKQLNDFKIIIAGDYENVAGGSIKDQLDKSIEKYSENILFTGYLDDKQRNQFYSGLDVLVLPSIDPLEAFGMVQVEAMLCGTPVVASDLPGVREVVRKTGYGRISKIKDPNDIANQIVKVIKHPKKYKPSRNGVLKYFDPQLTVDEYIKLMPKKSG